jgi:hypothetical protein
MEDNKQKTVTFVVHRTEWVKNKTTWKTEITLDEIRKNKPNQTKSISDEEVIQQVEMCPEDYMELYLGDIVEDSTDTIDIQDKVEVKD